MKKQLLLFFVVALSAVSVANAQERELRVYQGGKYQSFSISEVDSVKVVEKGSSDGNASEDQISKFDFIEVTIDGETKKLEWTKDLYFINQGFQDEEGRPMEIVYNPTTEIGRMGNITLIFSVYKFQSDFKLMTPGTYPMRYNGHDGVFLLWWGFGWDYSSGSEWPKWVEDDVRRPFDSGVEFEDSNKRSYYSNGGTFVIENIIEHTESFDGISSKEYVIKGTFSCKLAYYDEDKLADDMSKTKECYGSFQMTIYPSED